MSNPTAILHHPVGRDLVTKWISTHPSAGLAEAGEEIAAMVDYLSGGPGAQCEKILSRRFPVLRSMRCAYESAYNRPEAAPATAVEKALLFSAYMRGPLAADIGCGWNILGDAILTYCPEVARVIGFDIEVQHQRALPAGLEFRLMQDPLAVEMPAKSVNTVILSFVLHHLQVDIIAFLREVRRILAPGGRILILEDTFSTKLAPTSNGSLAELFRALPDDALRLSFLAFADWFIHSFVNRSRNGCASGNYRSMEEWCSVFECCGLHLKEQQHLGFSKLGSRNPVSRGFFVLAQEFEAPLERRTV